MNYILLLLITLILQACSVVGIRSTEEAVYDVVMTEGAYEIRRYAPVVAVSTSVNAEDFDAATDVTFNRLFKYITGNNIANMDIAMTAPVFSSESSEQRNSTIAMTSPVISSNSADESIWTLMFVLPSTYTIKNAPAPVDPNVQLVALPEKLVATRTFSGLWSQARFDEEAADLLSWLVSSNYTAISQPAFAGYDPPWTLPFFRRNEVMIDVE